MIDDRVKQIFGEALERAGSSREAYLAEACGDDAALRSAVETLLSYHEGAGAFLSSPTAGGGDGGETSDDRAGGGIAATTAAASPLREGPGTQIGPYKLLQVIGEGGFGVVYMAEQERPVRRRVA
ncbi:MAG: serine/threonine protein kinase, partial [Planctomycetota bacterium]